jgi:hypothetical protein
VRFSNNILLVFFIFGYLKIPTEFKCLTGNRCFETIFASVKELYLAKK